MKVSVHSTSSAQVKFPSMLKPYYKTDKCPKGHKLTKVGISACDDILECKCGKWMKYCNGGLIEFNRDMDLKKIQKEKLTFEIISYCGYLGCRGKITRYEGKAFWNEICGRCGWGTGGLK